MPMKKRPEEITLATLDVVVMPNGEVLFLGKCLGWVSPGGSDIGKYLTPIETESASRQDR